MNDLNFSPLTRSDIKKNFKHGFADAAKLFGLKEDRAAELVYNMENAAIKATDEKGTLLGFVVLGEKHPDTMAEVLYLDMIYVLPKYRRQGIGSLLYSIAVKTAGDNGYTGIKMDYDWGDPILSAFHKKNAEGFKNVVYQGD